MKRLRRWAIPCLGLVLIAVVIGLAIGLRAKPRAGITISRETTFITEPLREDGYPDYVAALNQIASEGVTPENNAAVLFCRAFGPRTIPEENRGRFFRMLGVPPLPPEGKYLVSLWDYVHRDKGTQAQSPGDQPTQEDQAFWTASDQLDEAVARPWSTEEFPTLVQWLEANEGPLKLIFEGTRRPRWYVPIVCEGGALWGGMWMGPREPLRHCAPALCARAMLRLKAGQVEEAHQDLLGCHRLARLASQGPMLEEDVLVAYGMESMACGGDAALAHYANLKADQARKLADDLRSLPPMPNVAEKWNVGARYAYLDRLCWHARFGPRALGTLIGLGSSGEHTPESPEGVFDSLTGLGAQMVIDANEALRAGNAWFDRVHAAFSMNSTHERIAALRQLEEELARLSMERRDRNIMHQVLTSNSPAATAGRYIVAVTAPAPASYGYVTDGALVRQRMALVAFALAAYRAEHGAYPADLAQVVPKYLKAVPEDTFSGKPLRYKREGAGYLLYSIRSYREDDGSESRFIEDPENAQYLLSQGLYIVTRMPVPKRTPQEGPAGIFREGHAEMRGEKSEK